ncbi:MAG: Fe-S oxidoreductase [Gammaproteobacteria bacterium]|nr:Fe-S oxidoreductase [Gammaproteobacteria bacterium]
MREGSLEAPTRHPYGQDDPDFYNEDSLFKELKRTFDICHSCRRCVNLCFSFPTLFDLVDNSSTMEVDGVNKQDYWKVVDQCYLCDLCYLTKCPYVPPHEWNLDFPNIMLRAKAIKYKQGNVKLRDKIITSTDTIGQFASIPIVVNFVNVVNSNVNTRKLIQSTLNIHPKAPLPKYHSNTLSKRALKYKTDLSALKPTNKTTGKVAIFGTCYGEYNEPQLGEDLLKILEHNGIPTTVIKNTKCCGMPKLELGDFDTVKDLKEHNNNLIAEMVNDGWDIMTPVPSCTLLFKQVLPLMFPNEDTVNKIKNAIFDPFEYLMLRHKEGLLNTHFVNSLGKVSYHVACHLRVQRIGLKTRTFLQLIHDTEISTIERCSGHDGTYALKSEFYENAKKLCRPVINKVKQAESDVYTSDCAMAGHHIANGLNDGSAPIHPITLARIAYGI